MVKIDSFDALFVDGNNLVFEINSETGESFTLELNDNQKQCLKVMFAMEIGIALNLNDLAIGVFYSDFLTMSLKNLINAVSLIRMQKRQPEISFAEIWDVISCL